MSLFHFQTELEREEAVIPVLVGYGVESDELNRPCVYVDTVAPCAYLMSGPIVAVALLAIHGVSACTAELLTTREEDSALNEQAQSHYQKFHA